MASEKPKGKKRKAKVKPVAENDGKTTRQYDLVGEPVPVVASHEVVTRHGFETEHFRFGLKDDDYKLIRVMEADALRDEVFSRMRAKPDVRSLPKALIEEEVAALVQKVRG